MEDETVAMYDLEPHLAYNTIGKQNDLLDYIHYSYKLFLFCELILDCVSLWIFVS